MTPTPAFGPNESPHGTRPSGRSVYPAVFLGAGLLVLIQAYTFLSPIILSFLLILLVSLALNPLVARMRGRLGGRKAATALLAFGLLAVIGLTAVAFLGPMKTSFDKFAESLPEYWARLRKPLIRLEKQAQKTEEQIRTEVSAELPDEDASAGSSSSTNGPPPPKYSPAPYSPPPALPPPASAAPSTQAAPAPSGLGQALEGWIGRFSAVAFNAAQILVILVTVFFGVTFMLMNPRPVIAGLFAIVPERHHPSALNIMKRVTGFVPEWAGATLAGMVTIGLLVTLALWPILGFTDALVLGLIAGVLESVPFVGPLLSAIPGLLIAAGKGGLTPVWVALVYAGVQVLENNVILPIIVARGMKLHPVPVMLSMLLCVAAFGVLGVLVAAPLLAIAYIIHEELYRKRFLPTVTDDDLDQLARQSLKELPKPSKPGTPA